MTSGTFPSLKPFGHRIGELLEAVETLDTSSFPQLQAPRQVHPVDALEPQLTEALERFANGAGRYEHLDSLWNRKTHVTTLDTWTELCTNRGLTG